MDKRLTLALLLSIAIIFVWYELFPPPAPPEDTGTGEQQQQGAPAEPGATPPVSQPAVSPAPGSGGQPASVPAPSPEDVAARKIYELSNRFLRVELTDLGAGIARAFLLDHSPTADSEGEPLPIIPGHEDGQHLGLRLVDRERPGLRLDGRLWQAEVLEEGRKIRFGLSVEVAQRGTLVLSKTITLPGDDARWLEVEFTASYPDGPAETVFGHEFELEVSGGVFQEEGASAYLEPSVGYHFSGSTIEEGEIERVLPGTVEDKGTEGTRVALSGRYRYLADVSPYFGAYFALNEGFPATAVGRFEISKIGDEKARWPLRGLVGWSQQVPTKTASTPIKGLLYLGANDATAIEDALKARSTEYAEAFGAVYGEKLGFVAAIGRVVITLLRALHSLVGNWGWAIVLLTIVVRLVLFPFNRRSQAAMMRHGEAMAKIKPKLDELKKKYKDDQQALAREQMALMKKEGVSMVPLGGCLPMLLQIPIFFGLFSALRASLELRQAKWFWVDDLSQPDHLVRFSSAIDNPIDEFCCICTIPQPDITGFHLLPILMMIAWFLNSYLAPRPKVEDPQAAQQRKMMMFMPLLFGFMMYGYAAGLSLYWLTSSTIGILETRVIKKWFPVKAPEKKKA